MEAWSSAYGHRARVFDIVFDAEGCRFATASEDCTARIWRERASDSPLRGYEQQTCLTGHEAEVLRVGWNHDGSMFATGSADTKARIWALRDDYGSTCETTLEPHPEELYCCEWMHLRPQSDNNRFLTASGNVVNVWDVEAASQLQQITMQTSEHDEDIPEAWKDCSVFACEQSDTGLAACPCSDGKTRVLAPRGATSHLDCVRTIHCSQDAGSSTMCMAAAFSADGFLLAVVTHDGCVLVYDVRTWDLVYRIEVGPGVMSISWRRVHELDHILITHGGKVLQIQMPSGATSMHTSGNPHHRLLCHAFSSKSKRLAAAGEVIAALPDAAVGPSSQDPSTTAGTGDSDAEELSMLFDTSLTVSRPAASGRSRAGRGGKGSAGAGSARVDESLVGRCPIDVWQL